MATLPIHELMHRVPLFDRLDNLQLGAMAGSMQKVRFKRNALILEEGKRADCLYVILSGAANVVISNDKGKVVVLATFGPGDYCGEMSLIDAEPHSASVVAVGAVDALALTGESFMKCIVQNPPIAIAVMRGLVGRLRKANKKIGALVLVGVTARVAGHLLDIAETSQEGELTVPKKLSHVALSKVVGSSREMVSKSLKELEKNDFLRKNDKGLYIINERRTELRA